MITFEEFKKTIYYTEKNVVIPLSNLRLDKVDFIKKGKIDIDLVNAKILEIYENYFNSRS